MKEQEKKEEFSFKQPFEYALADGIARCSVCNRPTSEHKKKCNYTMNKSNEHLFRCLDIMKADSNLSEETKIIMFVEYGKMVAEESKATEWVKYSWNDLDSRPKDYGRYEVYRKGCDKQHYETWNGSGWSSNNGDITHYRVIKSPHTR